MWVKVAFNNHRNGSRYITDMTGIIASRIGITPFGDESIGRVNGRVSGIVPLSVTTRYNYSKISALSEAGFATFVFRPLVSGGLVHVNSLRTMAHRNSDYRKVSTIRSVNRVIQGIRNIAEDYIGLAYNSANIASLRTAVNGYLAAEQREGVHNGAIAQISFSREDKILET